MRRHDKLDMLRPPKSHTARVHVRLESPIRASRHRNYNMDNRYIDTTSVEITSRCFPRCFSRCLWHRHSHHQRRCCQGCPRSLRGTKAHVRTRLECPAGGAGMYFAVPRLHCRSTTARLQTTTPTKPLQFRGLWSTATREDGDAIYHGRRVIVKLVSKIQPPHYSLSSPASYNLRKTSGANCIMLS
jgi:hypothetical protein